MKYSVPDYIMSLKPYEPGKPIAELEREYGVTGSSKIASNENPIGPSPKAIEAILGALGDLHRYPDGGGYALLERLARYFDIDKASIVLGNGSDEIIGMLATVLLDKEDEAIMTDPSFLMYEIMVRTQGAIPVFVPLKSPEAGFDIDLEKVVPLINDKTKIIFLTNPNNPTGAIIDKARFDRFIAQVPPTVVVVIDEAYIEFADDPDSLDSLGYLQGDTPVAILRTFSKLYGLAGLRVGYGIMPPALVNVINRIRQPFNVNSLAQVGAVAALDDTAFVEMTKAIVKAQIARMMTALAAMGYRCFPTQTNFFLVDVAQDADTVFNALLYEGVITRSMRSYGYPQYLRITAGNAADTDKFILAMKKITRKAKRDFLVTIDGPSGAGKTTVSKKLAEKLGYKYVDTGALYRGIAYEAKANNIDTENTEILRKFCEKLDLDFLSNGQELRLCSSGKDISDSIRTPEMSMLASDISAKKVVRDYLLAVQKEMGGKGNVVFEGRDMGTVVFPDADIKFYLDAALSVRAKRRYLELLDKGETGLTPEQVEDEVRQRDKNDMNRDIAPLKQAPDAIFIDATDIDADGVIDLMLKHIKKI